MFPLPLTFLAGVCSAMWGAAAFFYFSQRESAPAAQREQLAIRYYLATGAVVFAASIAGVAFSFHQNGVFERMPIALFCVMWLIFWGGSFCNFPRMKKAPVASVRRNVVFYVGTGGIAFGLLAVVCLLVW
ncbi:MAG: hypothetical protein PVJ92_01695 [Candidatus Dependentiae bacterium]|jgi:hypothetical protein